MGIILGVILVVQKLPNDTTEYSLNEWYISNSVLSIDTCFHCVFHKTQAEVEVASLLIKPELHSEIGSYRRESKFF